MPVPHVPGMAYDPDDTGGTSTLLVGHNRRLVDHRVSLAGTVTNCAGGPSPWDTWLTCEEDDDVLSMPHGYVFEVDPWRGGNPEPIRAMGRLGHEALAFDQWLVGITDDGGTFPFAKNPVGDDEFAGATFSPHGNTLFVNIQGSPVRTFAIHGPWRRGGR